MFACIFCEEEWVYITNLCPHCRRLKHLKKIYGSRFNDVLEEVLIRKDSQQQNKIHLEIDKEREKLERLVEMKIKTRSCKERKD